MKIGWCVILLVLYVDQIQTDPGSFNAITFMKTFPNFVVPKISPEVFLRAPELITYYGYSGETHTLQTEDGYLCDLFRIRGSKGVTKNNPVLLIHGFFTSCIFWIINTANNSLGFVLAEQGYDVWLLGLRGTTYCTKHVKLSPLQKEFWEYSWDEQGNYDVSAAVDFILKTTGKKKVVLGGHSKGTSSIYSLLANRTDYQEKVRGALIYASITDLRDISAPGILLAFLGLPVLQALTTVTGIFTYPPLPSPGLQICQILPFICILGNVFTEGTITAQTDYGRTTVTFSHLPDFTSLQDIKHFYQVWRRREFYAYEYGSAKKNKQRYGTEKAPLYQLSSIKTPIAIFYGKYDHVSTLVSAKRAKSMLPNVITFHEVPFTHIDYFVAKDLRKLLIEPTLKILNNWET